LGRHLIESSARAETCIVDQKINLQIALGNSTINLGGSGRSPEIQRNHHRGRRPVFLCVLRDVPKTVFAACDQHEIVSFLRELESEFLAQSAGCSGYERCSHQALNNPNSRRKCSIVLASPVSSGTVGSHPSFWRARLMSGLLRAGSSGRGGWQLIADELRDSLMQSWASSRIVNSSGFPRFTGPVKPSTFIMRTIPS